ncbi:MAG: glycosyltransferase 87 family protein [Propionicimonas sp.]
MKFARNPWTVWGAWLASRAATVLIWILFEPNVDGDVTYYWTHTSEMIAGTVPVAQTMVEYPTPVLWLLQVPWLLSGQTQFGFLVAFMALLLLADLAFSVSLWARGRGVHALWFWIAFFPLMGPLTLLRLDLVPALLCAAALLALRRQRSVASGLLLAAGAGLKLWPALLWPTSLRGTGRGDRRLTVAFFAGGVALIVAAVAYGGIGRLLSPLAWQSARGLQIESIWATPLMVIRVFDPAQYEVAISRWQAFEIFGPGRDAWLNAASLATMVSYLVILVAYLVWLNRCYPQLFSRRPSLSGAEHAASITSVGLFMAMVITITLIANKTFSPQYLIWLAAPVAALLLAATDAGVRPSTVRTIRTMAVWTLALAAGTHLVFPLTYAVLWTGAAGVDMATAVLVARNLAMLVFAIWLTTKFIPVLRQPALDG